MLIGWKKGLLQASWCGTATPMILHGNFFRWPGSFTQEKAVRQLKYPTNFFVPIRCFLTKSDATELIHGDRLHWLRRSRLDFHSVSPLNMFMQSGLRSVTSNCHGVKFFLGATRSREARSCEQSPLFLLMVRAFYKLNHCVYPAMLLWHLTYIYRLICNLVSL
jgi:hypothetical protein